MTRRSNWVDHVIWWQVYPLGFVGAEPRLDGLGAEPRLDGLGAEPRLDGVGAEARPDGVPEPQPHQLLRITAWLDHLVSLGCNGLLLGPIFTSSTHGYDTVDYFHVDPRLGDDDDFDELVAACRQRGIRVLLDGVFNHAGRDFPQARKAFADPRSEAATWFRMHDNDGMVTADYFEGHDQLITFNHEQPAVRDFVRDVMLHWLGRGIDGWRLDAAYAVPAEFWAAVLPEVRAEHPDAWFVGEMIHGDYPAYVAASGLDSITQYEVWHAVWSSLRERNLWSLDWTLGRHRDLVERLLPMTFLGNHDTTRVASQIDDPRHLPHAVALLAFLPGIPSIYYGDEFGLEAVKEDRVGGDDAVRPEMPAERGLFAGGDGEIESVYRRLIGLRRRENWLTDAVIATSEVANEHLLVHARPRQGDGAGLTLALNLADEPWALPNGARVVEAGAAAEAAAQGPAAGQAAAGQAAVVPAAAGQVGAHSWAIVTG